VEVRSYRRVFALERRIYRIDRLRLNPGGVPVRGIVYFLVLFAASAIIGRLPLLGRMAGVLPWYLRNLALPGASATLLTIISLDGRPFHLAAHALIGHWTRPRHSIAGTEAGGQGWWPRPPQSGGGAAGFVLRERWHPQPILIVPDGSDPRMRRLRYTGPGAVLIALEHDRGGRATERGAIGRGRGGRRPELILRERPAARGLTQGTVVALATGVRLRVSLEKDRGGAQEQAGADTPAQSEDFARQETSP
jgi:hypothetical protein